MKLLPMLIMLMISLSFGDESKSESMAEIGISQSFQAKKKEPVTSVFKIPFQKVLELYRSTFSSLDGPQCMFHPSCSRYCSQVIQTEGLTMGIIMTGDRLLRCNPWRKRNYHLHPVTGELWDPPQKKD